MKIYKKGGTYAQDLRKLMSNGPLNLCESNAEAEPRALESGIRNSETPYEAKLLNNCVKVAQGLLGAVRA